MPVKYRKFFWPTVVLIAVTASALVFVSARTRKVTPPVREQSLSAARRTDKPPLTLATLKGPQPRTSEQPSAATAQSDAVARPDSQSREEQVEVEVITVRANGFEPHEITRRHGPFMLAISNHSGTTELALRLDRVQGTRVHEVPLPKGRVRWNRVFDLPPGDYVLSEQNHPDWVCRIRLTAR